MDFLKTAQVSFGSFIDVVFSTFWTVSDLKAVPSPTTRLANIQVHAVVYFLSHLTNPLFCDRRDHV